MNKKWLYTGLHLLGWLLLAIGGVRDFMDSGLNSKIEVAWVKASGWPPLAAGIVLQLAYQAVSMIAFYTAYAWIAPALFPRVRYGRAFGLLIAVCAAMVATRYVMEFRVLRPLLHFENYFGRPVNAWWYIKNCIAYTYNYCLFGILLFFLVHSGRVQQERVEAELAFLRSQIHPHFLFNTLNDIYSLVYHQRKEAPEAILKLSGILRYALYEEDRDSVSLEKELAYLTDYLDLQRIGSNQQTFIDFRVEGETESMRIAPLLLIPFVENMIKHGVTDDPAGPATLHIHARDGHFRLNAVNLVRTREKDATGGVGLQNVRRRLELIYPGQHSFRVTEDGKQFHCILHLNLNA